MSNINDSFIRISEIMRNSILSFNISAEVKESITRMNDQVKNIVKVYGWVQNYKLAKFK